ncbi:MAG: hypothetical protein ACM3KR_01885 [Deltaproteobacteria bacterium]
MKNMKKKLTNPLFLIALFGFIYQVLQYFGIKIPDADFKTFVDLISYIVIGTGVYSTYDK